MLDLKLANLKRMKATRKDDAILEKERIKRDLRIAEAEYEKLKNVYSINRAFVQASRKETLIMHPLPRVNELSTDVDDLPNAAYFRQAAYGVFVRMALLCLVTGRLPE